MQRLAIEIAGGLVLLGVFALWERHQGAAGCLNANKIVIARQELQAAVITAADVLTIREEVSAYADTIRLPVQPLRDVPRVRCVRDPAPATVPADDTTGPVGDAGHRLSTADGGSLQSPSGEDITGPALTIGRDANAQVKALKDYITHVCLRP